MWGTKLLISPVKIRIFCPKPTKFSPKWAFWVRRCRLIWCLVGLVGGCGARAVSRKTPIYFIAIIIIINVIIFRIIIIINISTVQELTQKQTLI